MSNWLPSWYKEWIARVSNIVSYVFPFDWIAEETFMAWLEWKKIKHSEYMKTAQDWGTEIHLTLEKYMEWEDYSSPLYSIHSKEIEWWKRYVDNLKIKYPDIIWKTEQVVLDNYWRFQWTIDLVRINEDTKQVWLYDYKSWEIVKKNYWLETKLLKSWQPSKPTEKLKKLWLQLSLYAEVYKQLWYTVEWLYWVWIHESWVYEYEVDLWGENKINDIINKYYIRNTNIPPNFIININKNMTVIELQTTIPDMPYSKAWITIEENDFEWKTIEERIQEWVRLQKYLLEQYTNWQF